MIAIPERLYEQWEIIDARIPPVSRRSHPKKNDIGRSPTIVIGSMCTNEKISEVPIKAVCALTFSSKRHNNFLNKISSIMGEKRTTENNKTTCIAISNVSGRSPKNMLELDDSPRRPITRDDST
jgi:hypothetical protein